MYKLIQLNQKKFLSPDLVSWLWGFIEKCFDENKFYVISQKRSAFSRDRMNGCWSVSGVTTILRKNIDDYLIRHVQENFTVADADLSGGAVSTKYTTEASLRLLDFLKDVIWNL
ncbi:hypothetical protein BDC45DRAFT_534346 [Circinella umbellata]|nr:hypothetical protein BDC45DRAFT_534346 [Circinella umbellata]